MGTKEKKNPRHNRKRREGRSAEKRFTEGASKRETSDSRDSAKWRKGAAGITCSRIMTREELRLVIDQFATCCEHFLSSPARCDIAERGKDGIYSLSITIYLARLNRSPFSSPLAPTENANCSTSSESSRSETLRNSGVPDGIFSSQENLGELFK
jgi:hypothetical protein